MSDNIKVLKKERDFIIRKGCTPSEYYEKYDSFLQAAKETSILLILSGKTQVKSDEEVELGNKSKISFFETELTKQCEAEQDIFAAATLYQIRDNPLYAYMYAQPIIAIDPIFPTQEEIAASRQVIHYNKDTYLQYLIDSQEDLHPMNLGERDEQATSIRPTAAYIGYGSNSLHEEIAANHVQRIRSHKWEGLAKLESTRTPTIRRLRQGDTIETIQAKLSDAHRATAETNYSKSHKAYEDESTRVAHLNALLLKFLNETVEGIQATSAAPVIRSRQWHLVLDQIRISYGQVDTTSTPDQLKREFQAIKLEATETVYQYMHRLRNIIANIQMIMEENEGKLQRIAFYEAYESVLLTSTAWTDKHPMNHQFTDHTTILQRIICGIGESRIQKVAYDFEVQVPKMERTIALLYERMIIGERALPAHQQIQHEQVSSVAVTNGKVGNTGKPNLFCAYHSFGGAISHHATEDCSVISRGSTKVDPDNSKFHVLKDNGKHFTPRESTNNSSEQSSGNKRKDNTGDDSKSRKKGPKKLLREAVHQVPPTQQGR
jgi:hypothetical protein